MKLFVAAAIILSSVCATPAFADPTAPFFRTAAELMAAQTGPTYEVYTLVNGQRYEMIGVGNTGRHVYRVDGGPLHRCETACQARLVALFHADGMARYKTQRAEQRAYAHSVIQQINDEYKAERKAAGLKP